MMTILSSSSWTTFLDCDGMTKTSKLLPSTMSEPLLGTSSHVYYHQNGQQASSMWPLHDAPLELAQRNLDDDHHFDIILPGYARSSFWCKPIERYHVITWSQLVHLLCFVCWSTWIHSLYFDLMNLVSYLLYSLRWCLEGKHECSHNLLQDMLAISSTLTWSSLG